MKDNNRSVWLISAKLATDFSFLIFFIMGVWCILVPVFEENDFFSELIGVGVILLLISIVFFGMSFSYYLKCYSFDSSVSFEKVKNDLIDASFYYDEKLVYQEFILPTRYKDFTNRFYVPISKTEVLIYKFDHNQKFTKEFFTYEAIKQNMIAAPTNPEKTNWVKKWQSDQHLSVSFNYT
ncbi:hypothetical protein [Alteromonas mediterranea]|uniref:hypothetical protein n=1 Tax=Alteromonas mediterranea TaxID=314275 RepID=UPI000AACE1D6|nr:hypothetical protein [Alteromonas mediterranea]